MRHFPLVGRVMFLAAMMFVTSAQAQIPLGSYPDGMSDGTVSLIYDPSNGNLQIATPGDTKWTTLEITSPNGMFMGAPASGLVQPPFDVFTPTKYFLLKTTGLGTTDLGNALSPGLDGAALAAELEVHGSVLPRGNINDGPHGPVNLLIVPEPSSIALIGFGLAAMAGLRRKRS